MSSFLMSNYQPLSVEFKSGAGAWLTDVDGNRYLDAFSGIAVCGLGHAHPAVQEAIADQASKLIHTSNIYRIPLQEKLAEKLIEHSGMDKVFFGNSGAEANEAAIKLARLHGNNKGINNPTIIVMEKSFHGRTMATLTATGNDKVKKGFAPLVEGFKHIPYNNLDALNEVAETTDDIVAVMVEPIIGEGGILIPDEGYLKAIRAFCDEHDCLMILDEIQTGLCRTGEWFAFQHEGIKPDVMTLAKALGNGVPIGACLASGVAADLFQPGSHGSTFGGNPLAARAALAVINVLEQNKLELRAIELGKRLLDGFKQSLSGIKGIKEIRGKGLMLAIELEKDCADLVGLALEEKLLINVTAGNVIRLLPPLVMSDDEADEVVSKLSGVLKKYLS
ncbi:MAG TPA: acetylornithine transaminase [Thiotrichaceae bacterium]|jgi:acetylornithine aminotransferase|nr:acetylornithine transaminase [Thiotrichaceae bacterium]HIM08746.1 acetylornithine transaminase [Gammaproteobacteria bacterium]